VFNKIASKDTPKSFWDFYLGQWVHPIRTAKKYPVAFTVFQLISFAAGITASKAIADALVKDIVIKPLIPAPAFERFDSPIETVYTPASYGRIIPDIDDVAMEVCR
jgi:hypothetical protein